MKPGQRVRLLRKIFTLFLLLFLGILAGCIEKEPLEDNQNGQAAEVRAADLRSYLPKISGMYYQFTGEESEYALFSREIKYVDRSKVQFHDSSSGSEMVRVYKLASDQITQVYQTSEFAAADYLEKTDDEPDEIILKTPLKVNNTWESAGKQREIISINETVTVPIGTYYNVLKTKTTFIDRPNSPEIYEYYAENVGLILREYRTQDLQVTSRLEAFGIREEEKKIKSSGELPKISPLGVNLSNPQLVLLTYQLERQLRSTFQSAYESYLNLKNLADYTEDNFQQILQVYQINLEEIALPNLVDLQLKRLKELYDAREEEVVFPSFEVVEQAKIFHRNQNTAQVGLSITKHFAASRVGGKAHSRTFHYEIELVRQDGMWQLKSIDSQT